LPLTGEQRKWFPEVESTPGEDAVKITEMPTPWQNPPPEKNYNLLKTQMMVGVF